MGDDACLSVLFVCLGLSPPSLIVDGLKFSSFLESNIHVFFYTSQHSSGQRSRVLACAASERSYLDDLFDRTSSLPLAREAD